ncbi:hypothetical protein BT93_B2817 [Corymbia citriodora subsp. variegata]|nr:hypothetical protein BT93_B2817 [Corymbia citriodora subsp. variegata]
MKRKQKKKWVYQGQTYIYQSTKVHYARSSNEIDHAQVAPFAHGRRDVVRESKDVAKTIETEDGDVIDCVDIEKQPALDHPLLKGHKIQMKPSSLPERIQTEDDWNGQAKIELKSVNCPRGTVPILRNDITTKGNAPVNSRGYGFGFRSSRIEDAYATTMDQEGGYIGILGLVNVWNPKVEIPDEASGAYIWAQTGLSGDKNLNVAGAGWTVNPTMFGDNSTRFVVFWTRDNFIKTGCFNHKCPGFVQVSQHRYLGGVIAPLSVYGDHVRQYDIPILILQDITTKHWWLVFQGESLGYWPTDIFTELSAGAESLSWGGKIMRSRSQSQDHNGNASQPEMGSGHLSAEGFSRACFIYKLGLVNRTIEISEPKSLTIMTTSRERYDMSVGTMEGSSGSMTPERCQIVVRLECHRSARPEPHRLELTSPKISNQYIVSDGARIVCINEIVKWWVIDEARIPRRFSHFAPGICLEPVEIPMASPRKLAVLFLVLFLANHAPVVLFVHGRRDVPRESKNVAKTIETENGDVIDCVDMEKQPALNHPLLKGHEIQMEPTSFPEEIKTKDDRSRQANIELKRVNCPRGTVPIVRTNIMTNGNSSVNYRGYGFGFRSSRVEDAYATVMGERGNYTGTSGLVNVWNPKLEIPDEASGAYIWAQTGIFADENLNVAGAGWTVNPTVFGDNDTRFVVFWTRDNFIKTGCFNHICPGFVQLSQHQYLGGVISPLSVYGDPNQQYHLPLQIFQDSATNNWWLILQNETLGYWPSDIFTDLSAGAESLSWGGKILLSRSQDQQGNATQPEMGSGHLPQEGFSRACFVLNISLLNKTFDRSAPKSLAFVTTSRERYDVTVGGESNTESTIYFGGS